MQRANLRRKPTRRGFIVSTIVCTLPCVALGLWMIAADGFPGNRTTEIGILAGTLMVPLAITIALRNARFVQGSRGWFLGPPLGILTTLLYVIVWLTHAVYSYGSCAARADCL